MRIAKQLSVALVNKPGRLAGVLAALAKEKIVCQALSVMDSGTRGTLRIVPEDVAAAIAALESASVAFDASDVLLVTVPSQPHGLQNICSRLASEHLNVDYIYGALTTTGGAKTGALAIIKVNDLAKAQRVLSDSLSTNGSRQRKRPGRRPAFAR